MWRRLRTGRTLWLVLPAALLVFMGASSPEISQRVPRFVFPFLAAVGAALLVFSFVNSLVRFVRFYRRDGRSNVLPLVVNALATLLLVVLPLTRIVGVIAASGDSAPRILAGFGDWRGAEGYPRPSAHRGVDIAGRPGADVLAAADGRVSVARDNRDLCGLIVVIDHDFHPYRTVYCHLSAISVAPGESVTRGQRIGALGTSGQRAWPGYEHVHLELSALDRRGEHQALRRVQLQRGRDMNALGGSAIVAPRTGRWLTTWVNEGHVPWRTSPVHVARERSAQG